MIDRLLRPQVQKFIQDNIDKSLTTLALSTSPFSDIAMYELVEQIEGWQKAKEKLPSWSKTTGVIYPSRISMEQCSSEMTANYKASLISGCSLLDMTGGLGVDSIAFAKNFDNVVYCEQNQNLAKIALHNFKTFKINNIEVFENDAFNYLTQKLNSSFDCIYLDPSRRNKEGNRVYALDDCCPNITTSLQILFQHTKNILLKTSPMLDIKQVIQELHCVKSVYVVALKNEVREVLYLLEKNFSDEPEIHAVNLLENHTEILQFTYTEEQNFRPVFSDPLSYLYEPNPSLLKSGAFNTTCKYFRINKLQKNSHLYTSDDPVENFQGRSFKIVNVLDFGKHTQKTISELQKANITVRNFPENVEYLRKKLKVKDGGEDFLFFTTLYNEKKVVIHCRKK